jgi:hypothetical protein
MNKRSGGMLAAILIAFLTLATVSHAQETGSIQGQVLDEKGSPIEKARVSVDPIDGRMRSSAVREVDSDVNGKFVLDRLPFGTYSIFAKKEDSGYPDTRSSLYGNKSPSSAVLTAVVPIATVSIKLGPKAGMLTGFVTDAETAKPQPAGFKLVRANNPNNWLSTSETSKYRVLLPPSTSVLIEVSAPGYKTWAAPTPFNLASGEEVQLDIALQPSHDPSVVASEFLIPAGYVGWLRLEYGVKDAPSARLEGNTRIFKFPQSGVLSVSSPGPEREGERHYRYYAEDGSFLTEVPQDYRHGKGMIWGDYEGSRGGVMAMAGFFVGTEEQYKEHPHPRIH